MKIPRALMLLALLAGTAGCGRKLDARMPTALPPLDTPSAPPKVLIPPTFPDLPEPTPAPAAAPANQPRQTPPATSRPPDRPPTATPTPTPTPTPDPPPPQVLQTTAPTDLEQKTRAMLATAAHDLERVDARALSADARASYETAKGYIRRADEALKVKNLVYAKDLAEKAAALASLLVKRLSSASTSL